MNDRGLKKHRSASARNMKIVAFAIVFICVCLSFSAGFLVRGDQSLLKDLGFTALVTGGEESVGTGSSVNTYNSLSARLAEVEEMLNSDSLDTYDLEGATTDVLEAFTDSTKDEYLRYYDPARYAAYVHENTGTYAGIGVLFSEYKGSAYVVDVFPGSVAESEGVTVGDFLVAIDGDRSQDWSLTEAVNAVSRDAGESVVVTWRHADSLDDTNGTEFTTTLVCHQYSEINVTSELVESVGYLSIKQLTQDSAALIKKAIQNLSDQGATSFVLDIRDNPGGYLTQAVEIDSFFVTSGTIVEIVTKESTTTKTANGVTLTDKPLVVLVNENTAAAAEVLVAGLKDNGRATVVGHTTLGKGSVQVVRPLSFGGALRYTAAYYKSPLGHDINKVGVSPDIVVDGTTVNGAGETVDNQKKLALETAQSFVVGL